MFVVNEVGVQLLSSKLHSQIFPGSPFPQPSEKAISISRKHLEVHKLDTNLASRLPETSFDLPKLQGGSIDEHFYNLGAHMAEPWLEIAKNFAKLTPKLPDKPDLFDPSPGWTRYSSDGSFQHVDDLGSESAICFDVETLPEFSPFAVMACAVSAEYWYVWISPWLLGLDPSPEHLIPIGDPSRPRVIVGHHVSYDRARILEEYSMQKTKNRFLDTMSLHIAVKGISSGQRPAWMSHRKIKREISERRREAIETVRALLRETELEEDLDETCQAELLELKADLEESLPELLDDSGYPPSEEAGVKRWEDITAVNSLAELARLYCGIEMDKSTRDDFLVSSREEIAAGLSDYLDYCCEDVSTTMAVYQCVLPAFLKSCPNPVSSAGVLTMGSSFLTVDQEWITYINSAEGKYRELEDGVRRTLVDLAEEALSIYQNDVDGKKPWEADEWLSQLDWTPKKVGKSRGVELPTPPQPVMRPKWYRDIMKEKPGTTTLNATVPFLLNMRWQEDRRLYYLFFSSEHGWLKGKKLKKLSTSIPPEPSIEISEDDKLAPFRNKFWFGPLPKPKVRTLFSPARGGLWFKEGYIICTDENIQDIAMRLCTSKATKSDWNELRKIAKDTLEKANLLPKHKDFPIISQLDWTLVQVDKPPPQNPADYVYWPTWYWDITKPKPDSKPGTPDLTVRSRITPLLLRLRWLNYPLFFSRDQGWTYRVPRADRDKISATAQPLEFPHEADAKLKEMCQDEKFYFFKLPHKDGEEANVGSPMGKMFLKYSQDGTLAGPGDATKSALDMNAQCSYWISARDRVLKQVVMWDGQAGVSMGLPSPRPEPEKEPPRKYGMILPQVITMGTVTRRAIEKTWLTASNAKPNRIGSELKALVRSPEGYAMVGADVDSEELWIASVMGDAQFGIHGATAIGWMTLEGTKAAGTDLHSKTASILGISRNQAKVFNYSRIYGAGINHAVLLLLQHNASMQPDTAKTLAKNLYASTKGKSSFTNQMFNRKFWFGGTESYLFNKLEQIATSDTPQTPALGCGVTSALTKKHLPNSGDDYMTSRINWVVQSSGVDYLHMLIVAVDYLIETYQIDARYLISIHDEVRYLAKEKDKHRLALALQIANLWTRCMFAYKLGFDNLPQGVAFFSAVDIDRYLRKEVDMTCVTPSQPHPLPPGESLDIHQILEKTGGSLHADGTPSSVAEALDLTRLPKYEPTDAMVHRERSEEFLEAQSLKDQSEIRRLAQRARSRERELAAELDALANPIVR